MSDMEIMSAIGDDVHYIHERPALGGPRKSLLQKISERNQSFVQQMRSKREGFNRRESRDYVRSPTPSMVFSAKGAPVVRSPTELALRYDDLTADVLPAPIISKSLPLPPDHPAMKALPQEPTLPAEPSSPPPITELTPTHRTNIPRVDSSHSMISTTNSTFKHYTLRPSSSTQSIDIRPRTSPSTMSDQELDDWLEHPIDADLHRSRKYSLVSTTSSTTTNSNSSRASSESLLTPLTPTLSTVHEPRTTDETTLKRLTMSWMSDYFTNEYEADVEEDDVEDLGKWQISCTFLKAAERRHAVAVAKRSAVVEEKKKGFECVSDEVLRRVMGYLDERDGKSLRGVSRRFRES